MLERSVNKGGGTSSREIVNLRFATFTLLLAVSLLLGGSNFLVASTVEAQSVPVEVEVTPANFADYFDVDANSIATLRSAYAANHTLSFAAGEYPYAIRIQNASNVILRGANALSDTAQRSRIRTREIITGVAGIQHDAAVAVTHSTNVTFDGFEFDFSCLYTSRPEPESTMSIFFYATSGVISNNLLNGLNDVKTDAQVTDEDTARCGGKVGVNRNTSLRNIRVQSGLNYVPTIDAASNKVTNLMPVSIIGNKITSVIGPTRPDLGTRIGIQVHGYIDATITSNSIRNISKGIQIAGGASGLVAENTLFSLVNGIIYLPNWYVRNSPDGETIESYLEIRDNDIEWASDSYITLGEGCRAADGTRINANAKIIGNYISAHPPGSKSKAIHVLSCRGTEDERIKAEIVGNTFDGQQKRGDLPGTGILASATGSGSKDEAWFELKVRYNEFRGYLLGVLLNNLAKSQRLGVAHAKIDATLNCWGTGSASPAHLMRDEIQDPSVAELTYIPWTTDTNLCGHSGPHGRRTRDVRATLPIFRVSPQELAIDEGETENLEVSIDAAPQEDVRISFSSNHPDLSFTPDSVVFTPANWRNPQTVTVSAARDDDWDDEQTDIFATSVTDGRILSIRTRIVDLDVQPQDDDVQIQPHLINKIEPSIRSVTIDGGESVRLRVIPYGRQDIIDNSLIDGRIPVTWRLEEGAGSISEAVPDLDADTEPNDREILFTAPTAPGTYQVHATLASCGLDTSADCRATFTIQVLRRSALPAELKPEPVNPPGEIPSVLADLDGNQYEVFTPEEGGTFSGDASSLKAGPGAVPNGEIVGLRIAEGDAASNEGQTYQRYTLDGNWYAVSAVDASGEAISSYMLNDAVEVCVPLPDVLRANISDVALVAINPDESLTILSSRVRIIASSTNVCGNISSVPANIAVGSAGAPAPLRTEVPEPEEGSGLPETGGGAPSSAYGLIWTLLIGLFSVIAGGFAVMHGRLRRAFTAVKSYSSTG